MRSMKNRRAKIREGWFQAGCRCVVLGRPVFVDEQSWTPVKWEGSADPGFFKTAGLTTITGLVVPRSQLRLL
jgi:hypothetical protein